MQRAWFIAVICVALAASWSCGGSGGSGSHASVLGTSTESIGPAGGQVSTLGGTVTLTIPANALSASTPVTLSVLSGGGVGNPHASAQIGKTTQISLSVNTLDPTAQLTLTLPETQAPGTIATYGVAKGSSGLLVVPCAENPTTGQLTVSLKGSDFAPLSGGPQARDTDTSLLISTRSALANDSQPQPHIDFYKFNGLHRVGDPDASDSVYNKQHDFSLNWSLQQTPTFPAHSRVVVLVHGILNDLSNLSETAFYLKNLKTSGGSTFYDGGVFGCDVTWQASIKGNGAKLAAILAAAAQTDTTVDVIAHSQGGLVSRWALEEVLPGLVATSPVARLFTCGTPHEGVPLSVLELFAESGFVANLFPGVLDLSDVSDFTTALNAPGHTSTAHYFTLGGTDFQDYLNIGPLHFGAIAHYLEGGVDCDGIVPLFSAKGVLSSGHAASWQVLQPYPLDHSQMRGELVNAPHEPINLDTSGPEQLSTYILADSGGGGNPTSYHIVDLGEGSAWAVNDAGQVALTSNAGGSSTAFLYSGGSLHDLGAGGASNAFALNSSGQVVGVYGLHGPSEAFLYSSGNLTGLGLLPGGSASFGYGVNSSGIVVGESDAPTRIAVRWQSGVIADLNTLVTGGATTLHLATARAINASNQIVGGGTQAGVGYAYLFQSGTVTQLPTLGGNGSEAFAINDGGAVAGVSPITQGTPHAFLFQSGTLTDLGLLLGQGESEAYGINASGDVVGTWNIAPSPKAFIYHNGQMRLLDDLVDASGANWHLETGRGINQGGMIVGFGELFGTQHAFVAVPN